MERSEGSRNLGVLLLVQGSCMVCQPCYLGLPIVVGDQGRVKGVSRTISTLFIIMTNKHNSPLLERKQTIACDESKIKLRPSEIQGKGNFWESEVVPDTRELKIMPVIFGYAFPEK